MSSIESTCVPAPRRAVPLRDCAQRPCHGALAAKGRQRRGRPSSDRLRAPIGRWMYARNASELAQPRRPRRETGSILVWALFFVSLTTGILVAHTLEMSANRRTMDTRFRRVDLAHQVAESGLTDATAYLRRQPVQPVTEFAPDMDPGADPPVNDTIDPSVGLVREFEVHGSLWGRYEVRRDETIDVSDSYGEPAGTVWDIGARGILYERADPKRPFDQAPNRVLSMQPVRTEVRGITLDVPADAALLVADPGRIAMLGNATIDGQDGTAVAYRKPTVALPLPLLDVSITGSPIALQVAGLDLSLAALLDVREDRFRSLADLVVASPRQLQGRIIEDQAVFVAGSLELPPELCLAGRMLLVVDGDLVAAEGNDSEFRGIVVVRDDATLKGPFRFSGTMIVGGQVTLGGTADPVSLAHDAGEVTALQNALARYRISRDVRPSGTSGAFGTSDDIVKAADER